ncbi:MAG: MATE family efflux transporter [Odoribacter sp.]|nr:MATE family efflux transporter [Odoribacter sp.]
MKKITDLTQGSIMQALWTMAMPLISASFIQMAYSMTDMLWLGHLSSDAVAAVGAAAFFTWLCNALSFLTKTGSEITISQAIGAQDVSRAAKYANQAIALSLLLGIGYAIFIFTSAPTLIRFFHFEESIATQSIQYLRIIAPGFIFQLGNNTFCGIYNGQGNSKTPFRTIATGLIANIILDPLLIYGTGEYKGLGTAGAAIATLLSQLIVYLLFIQKIFSSGFPLGKMHFFSALQKKLSLRILLLGLPVSLESGLFSMFSLTLATLAARWGAVGVAAQSIGSQIEAISWMTATGFSTALASFVGQNYGARKYKRIQKGYRLTMYVAGSIGLSAGVLFFIFNREIFSLFVQEAEAIEAGGIYLKILALSQVFMVTELVTAGAFNGCGHTTPPALIGILLTGARIPFAYYLCSFPTLGLTGIWWSITISSILKGTIIPLWYSLFQKKLLHKSQS